MTKAVLLLSGGLDSTLAGKVLVEMGVEVEAVNFTSPFCRCTPKTLGCSAARRAAEQLGIPVRVFACTQEYLEIVKHPRFGRGSGMNPCLDCRIHIFSRAREHMVEIGADFIATGEVLGERPMSQRRRAMEMIERESGLQGLIVRPLTARLLPMSIPEKEGVIDREELGAIQGRCRRPQIEMARELGIEDYLCPAGGCLLTDREFAARVRDLLEHEPDFGLADARLLLHGRHFRLPSGTKVVVGRNEGENDAIERAFREGDVLLVPKEVPGPSVLCRGSTASGDVALAAGLLASHTKKVETVDIEVRAGGGEEPGEVLEAAGGVGEQERAEWRVCAERGKKLAVSALSGDGEEQNR